MSWKCYLVVLVLSLLALACGKSPEEARKELAELNIPFNEQSFIDRVKNGDTVAVSLFLQASMSPGVRDKHGNDYYNVSALGIAASKGYTAIVEALLGNGARIDEGGIYPPLYYAVMEGHRDVVAVLLANGAASSELTVWHAGYYGQSEILKLLLQHGEQHVDALYAAAQGGHTDIVEDLLNNGTDVNARNSDGWPALSRASIESAKLLLERGADVDLRSSNGFTPLHYAARAGQEPKVSLLLDSGANVNARVEPPPTASVPERITAEQKAQFWNLMQAKERKNETLDEEMGRLADETALFAVMFERTNEGFPPGSTALILAASRLNTDCVRVLLDNGADVNIEDRRGRTALMWGAYGRDKWRSLYGAATEDAYREVRRLLTKAGATE